MKNWKELFTVSEDTEFSARVFDMIGNEWFLITAGTADYFNTMTASWGTLGVLWNKPVAICFIRPTRHTYKFAETNDVFTMSFFSEEHRHILKFCGAKSGRDTNKVKETGLLPLLTENGGITFEQAKLVFECRKLYFDDIKPGMFLSPDIDKNYPNKDYHRLYIGEITSIYKKA
jgi:flavin reductase (DIM6/NTAB) family NADH-FMN oxidoreductase RutF